MNQSLLKHWKSKVWNFKIFNVSLQNIINWWKLRFFSFSRTELSFILSVLSVTKSINKKILYFYPKFRDSWVLFETNALISKLSISQQEKFIFKNLIQYDSWIHNVMSRMNIILIEVFLKCLPIVFSKTWYGFFNWLDRENIWILYIRGLVLIQLRPRKIGNSPNLISSCVEFDSLQARLRFSQIRRGRLL